MKLGRAFLTAFNVLARLFGSLAILAGIVFLVSAYAIKENRSLDVVLGLFALAMGIAVFFSGQTDRRGTTFSNETPDGASRSQVVRKRTMTTDR
jgi:uncharacterized membrane protein HdeD (DUF308 family)